MPEYKDMLGKTLNIGQTALNIFIQNESGEPIGHRLCEIIKINPGSVRIEFLNKKGILKRSSIYRTTNRLIILEQGDGSTSGGDNVIKNRWEILDFKC